jgi:hypothetical protein
MDIKFNIVGAPRADWAEELEKEMVGWDPNFTGSTGGSCRLEDGVWVTAWSDFEYWYDYDYGNYTYQGAGNGFLAQRLLPEDLAYGRDHADKVVVCEVSGTYGFFKGADALKEYNKKKTEFTAEMADVRQRLETRKGSQIDDRYIAKVMAASFEALVKP